MGNLALKTIADLIFLVGTFNLNKPLSILKQTLLRFGQDSIKRLHASINFILNLALVSPLKPGTNREGTIFLCSSNSRSSASRGNRSKAPDKTPPGQKPLDNKPPRIIEAIIAKYAVDTNLFD